MGNQTFDFSEALRRMKEGKWVHRGEDAYTIKKGKLIIADCINGEVDKYNIFCTYGMVADDILATDWEEVE